VVKVCVGVFGRYVGVRGEYNVTKSVYVKEGRDTLPSPKKGT